MAIDLKFQGRFKDPKSQGQVVSRILSHGIAAFILIALVHGLARADLRPWDQRLYQGWKCNDLLRVIRAAKLRRPEWRPETNWKTTTQKPTATVFFIHGINGDTSSSDELAQEFNSMGADFLRINLHGHGPNATYAEFRESSSLWWKNDVYYGYCVARERADLTRTPLILMGHSLGGLMVESLLNLQSVESIRADRVVLLAPALIRPSRSEMAALSLIDVYSAYWVSDQAGRADHSGASSGIPFSGGKSPYSAVQAIHELAEELGDIHYRNSHQPTLILVHSRDPIVKLSELVKLQAEMGLKEWHVKSIDSPRSLVPMLQDLREDRQRNLHGIVGKTNLGRDFPSFLAKIKAFLELHTSSTDLTTRSLD